MKTFSRCLLALALFPLAAGAEDFKLSEEKTSQRIAEEDLQWMGYSVTVIEAEEWNETPRWNLSDLEGMAPGLIVDPMSSTPMGAAISVRGVSSDRSSAAFFPAVAVKVDDVYIGTHASQNQVLFDFDRVEVRRNPQGDFEGAPAMGGAIAVYRNQPTQELTARTMVTVGDYDLQRVGGVANIPWGEKFAARIAATIENGGDFITNISPDPAATERSENNVERFIGRAAFRWQQNDDLSVRYTADVTRDTSDVPARANISTSSNLVCDRSEAFPNCAIDEEARLPETGDFLTTTQNFSNVRRYDVDQHAFHIDYRWRNLSFSSITAWRDSTEFSAFDNDGTYDNSYSSIRAQDYDQFTQEFSVQGSYSEDLDYSAGIFILENDYQLASEDFFVLPLLDNAGRIISVTPDASRKISASQDASLISFFLQGDYDASAQWNLDAGIRWTSVDRSFSQTVSRPAAGGTPLPAIISGKANSAEAIGSVGATYRVDDEAIVYIRYSRGFRPVAFNDQANSIDGARPLGEESTDGFEVGLKTEWFDDRLRLNYVGYQNTWRDKIESYGARVPSGRVESILANTAKVEIRGHELELEAVPIPQLRLRASLSHVNADYQEYEIPDLAGGTDPVILADLVPARSPADMFGFSGLYTMPYGEAMVRIFASYRFTREYNSNPSVPAARINHFSMLDLSVDYEWRDWTFRLFSRNLNGKRYFTNVSQPVDAELASLAPTFTGIVPIATTADFNEPEFTGLQIIYVPPIGR